MIKNKWLNSILCATIAVSLLWGNGLYALADEAQDTTITKTQEFETTDKNDDGTSLFSNTITENGKTYQLENIITTIKGTKEEEGDILYYESAVFADEATAEKPKDTMTKDGKTYKLKETELIEKTVDERTKYTESEITYNAVEVLDAIPDNGKVKVTDTSTGQEIETEMPFIKIQSDETKWIDDFSFPILIADYDADYFLLNNTKVYKGDNLIDYKDEFLEYLGLSKNNSRITSIEWNGEAYKENGTVYRKAVANGEKLVHDIVALYGGEVQLPAFTGKAYKCKYVNADSDSATGSTVYTIEATATYKDITPIQEQSMFDSIIEWIKKNPTLAIGIGTLSLIIFVVILFVILSKKDKKEEKKKYEIIDIDNKKDK